jgi:Na+-driven multidrug efflux pump
MPPMNPTPNTSSRLLALFALGLVLFLPPVVGLSAGSQVLGIPSLFVGIFASWALVVALLALIMTRARRARDSDNRT